MEKIALGTVQFGLDYGIHNQRGQVTSKEVRQILEYAFKQGVDTIDTAAAYGNSEEILGAHNLKNFQIVSKLFPKKREVRKALEDTLKHLDVSQIYSYLFHRFEDVQESPKLWTHFQSLKLEGKVQKIGFSLYHPHELEYLWEHGIEPDLIQIPYNIFDRRFEYLFELLSQKKVEIHTRSAFLQGLFFKNPDQLPPFFQPITHKLQSLHQIAEAAQLPISALCLGFCLANPHISRVVIGVDSLGQLKQNLAVKRYMPSILSLLPSLEALCVNDVEMINPAKWQL